jgi:hypothetical protein
VQGLHTPPRRPSGQASSSIVSRETSRVSRTPRSDGSGHPSPCPQRDPVPAESSGRDLAGRDDGLLRSRWGRRTGHPEGCGSTTPHTTGERARVDCGAIEKGTGGLPAGICPVQRGQAGSRPPIPVRTPLRAGGRIEAAAPGTGTSRRRGPTGTGDHPVGRPRRPRTRRPAHVPASVCPPRPTAAGTVPGQGDQPSTRRDRAGATPDAWGHAGPVRDPDGRMSSVARSRALPETCPSDRSGQTDRWETLDHDPGHPTRSVGYPTRAGRGGRSSCIRARWDPRRHRILGRTVTTVDRPGRARRRSIGSGPVDGPSSSAVGYRPPSAMAGPARRAG